MMSRRIAVLALVLVLPGSVAATAADEHEELIQPGALISLEGGSRCTLNWVYDEVLSATESELRDPRVFVGTAAHCATGIGEDVALASLTAGLLVDRGQTFGQVAYLDVDLDFALIEVAPAFHEQVDAAMRGHPSIPTGVSTTETAASGDLMQYSGYGNGYSATAPTREERVGVLDVNDGRQHWVFGSVTPGDSGGPVANLTDGGTAFGVVTKLGSSGSNTEHHAGQGGASVEGALVDAAAAGLDLRVRTVDGPA